MADFTNTMQKIQQIQNPYGRSEATPEQIARITGTNIDDINSTVDSDISRSVTDTYTEDEFMEDVKTIMSDNSIEFDEAFDVTVNYYHEKGYGIKGQDINTLYRQVNGLEEIEEEVPIGTIEKKKKQESEAGAMAFLQRSQPKMMEIGASGEQGFSNIVGGALTKVPEITGDTSSWLLGLSAERDYVTPFGYGIRALDKMADDAGVTRLGDYIRQRGEENTRDFRERLGVDPDATTTKAGGFIGDLGASIATPGGSVKLMSNLKNTPQVANWLSQSKGLKNAFDTAELAMKGAEEGAKFDIVSEGDVSSSTVMVGATANPLITGIGKAVSAPFKKDLNKMLAQVISPKPGNKEALKQIESVGKSLKQFNKRPSDIKELYTDLEDIQKQIYQSKIMPAMNQASKQGAVIDTNKIFNEAIEEAAKGQTINGKSFMTALGKEGELEDIYRVYKNFNKNFSDLDILEAEKFKKLLGDTLREDGLKGFERTFLEKINGKLGKAIDDKVKGLTGEGVKDLKTQYRAISQNIDELGKQIVRYEKQKGSSLFEGLGKISGMGDIVEGRPVSGITQLLVGKVLREEKDINTILGKYIDRLYRGEGAGGVIRDKTIGVSSSVTGQYWDDWQRERLGIE